MTPRSALVTSSFFKSASHKYELLWHLVKREFILQYKRSALGVLWSLLLPLGQLIVLIFIFQKVVPLKIDAYPVFLFSALLPWSWFSNCVNSAGFLLINNRDLLRKPNFHPYTLILVNVMSNLLLFLVALPILFIFMPFFEITFSVHIIYLPLLIVVQGLLMFGTGLIIATLNVFYTDIQHIIGVGLMMLFFITPVFYSVENVGESIQFLYSINPIAAIIQNYRLIIYNGSSPDWNSLLFATVVALFIIILGYLIYNRQIHKVIDIL
jgi:lipopolysaccharide transport system permease protein